MRRPEKGDRSPGASVTGSHVWATHGWCWEWNLGPLQEQQALLTTEAFRQLLDSLLISHLRTFELVIWDWSPIKLASLLFGLVKQRGLLHLFGCLCHCFCFFSFLSPLNPIQCHKCPLGSSCGLMSCPLLTTVLERIYCLNRSQDYCHLMASVLMPFQTRLQEIKSHYLLGCPFDGSMAFIWHVMTQLVFSTRQFYACFLGGGQK